MAPVPGTGWMKTMVGVLFVIGWFGFATASRPELVDSSVWYIPNSTLLNVNFDAALVQMDFDQPLYTNGHTFLCPQSTGECPELTCKACDWSGSEPTGCDDPECCGPAQHGDMETAARWCGEGPEYTTLSLDEISERFTLEQGESMYVRFHVPEEYYCRPINIIPRPYYGVPSGMFSTIEPYPSFSTNTGWRNHLNKRTFGYGQTSLLICPNTTVHPEYNVGTFAGMFYAITPTSFEVEILVSPEAHPLAAPAERISCDDVPEQVLIDAGAFEDIPALCVEDGETAIVTAEDTNPDTNLISFVFPVPKGCHTLSFTSASQIPTNPSITHHKYCLPSDMGRVRGINNAGLFRISAEGEGMVLSACFDEDTYLICSLRIYAPEPIHFTFSSVAPVVRRNILELPDYSLSMMDGLQHAWSVTFGEEKYPCVDQFAACFDWIVPPSDNTIPLFPPPASPRYDTESIFEDIQEIFRDAGIQEKKANRLSFTLVFRSGTTVPVVKNLETLSLVITAITNQAGEVVSLPGGGVDVNDPENLPYSMANYVSHIPLSEVPLFEFPPCDADKYSVYQGLVQERLDAVQSENNLQKVLALKYSLDAMNEAVLAQSCTTQVANNLETYVTDVVVKDSDDCLSDYGTIAYWLDPCCNVFIGHVSCCTPFDYNKTETPYGNQADVSGCGEPECAQSYYEDLSFSLNHFEDIQLGCTSGIQNPTSTFARDLVEAIQPIYVDCLDAVGFGGVYRGVSCQVDSDCTDVTGICYDGICALPDLDELEARFLECYIDNMPSSLESFLKRNVLPDSVADKKKSSAEFYEALAEAATIRDCVNPHDPLSIEYRTRYQIRPADYACTGQFFGLEWPEQQEEIYDACPGDSTLRSFGVYVNASSCINYCFDWTNDYIEATEEDCPTGDICDIDIDGDCDDEFHCVYCPADGSLPCTNLPQFTNEDECNAAVACELPDGSLDFSLTEEECSQQGEGCTQDCVGNSCESILKMDGACFVPSITSSGDCSLYSSDNDVAAEWYDDACVLSLITSETDCSTNPATEWVTCHQNELSECNGDTTQKKYLGCYVSLWHECPNQEECEASGRCTDREMYTLIHSYQPAEVQYGACMNSGEYVAETKPSCGSLIQYETVNVGCRAFTITDPSECENPSFFIFAQWVEPAMTEAECLANEVGRSGCRIYKDTIEILLWINDDDECDCRGGAPLNAWEWLPGVWKGGVPRSLEWRRAEVQPTYQYKEALSFIMLADWIKESTQEQFLYPFQSQVICESVSITNPVFTLVCDCLEDGGETCYDAGEEQKEIQMGLSEVCEGQVTFVKDPSAQVTFGNNSVSDECSFLNISIIYRNWFAAPFVPPPLSFKWEEPKERGVVINKNEATVGEVLGDGLVLTFERPEIIDEFYVCLRLGTEGEEDYKVRDFGYTTSELENIYPLGLKIKQQDGEEDAGIWYCGAFDFQDAPTKSEGAIRLFPINRIEDYEDEEDNYVSGSTEALCYTLGALYCTLGLLSAIAVCLYVRQILKIGKSTSVQLPLFCTSTFVLLCIFRACFMFLYPNGTFEYEPLSYFIVFEIPTFLLFSVLIFMIYSFKRLVYKKGFFPGNPTPILVIGWGFVWALWVLVTIVYSEVILDSSSGTSACEGRVEKSYDSEEEDTRNLAIAYQSVIIVVTFALATIFFYYTYKIYSTAKAKKSGLKQFIIVVGGSFNVAFFLRTILFLIILAADFASSVYMFITLFITEILMMTFLLVQFNIRYVKAIASTITESTTFGSGATASHHSSAQS